MRFSIALLLSVFLAACGGTTGNEIESYEQDLESCECLGIWDPVCGTDGKTYSSDCHARCAGVPVKHRGECRPFGIGLGGEADATAIELPSKPIPERPRLGDCMCPHVYDPVCGVNGVTYGNGCEASCAGVEVAHRGRCDGGGVEFMGAAATDADVISRCDDARPPKDVCMCPQVIEPVCGKDGNTYDNACLADCAGVCVAYEGECTDTCNCPAVIDPVCGVDGNTYDNSCLAACAGVDVKDKGRCETDSAN